MRCWERKNEATASIVHPSTLSLHPVSRVRSTSPKTCHGRPARNRRTYDLGHPRGCGRAASRPADGRVADRARLPDVDRFARGGEGRWRGQVLA